MTKNSSSALLSFRVSYTHYYRLGVEMENLQLNFGEILRQFFLGGPFAFFKPQVASCLWFETSTGADVQFGRIFLNICCIPTYPPKTIRQWVPETYLRAEHL